MFEERQSFINYLRFEKRYSPHTLTAYQNDLEQFRTFLIANYGHTELKLITHFHIRGWLAGMKEDKQTARTINRKISSLNSYYNNTAKSLSFGSSSSIELYFWMMM